MPIYQTNLFICDICGDISTETEAVFLYDDDPLNPPNAERWETNYRNDLCCPECIVNFESEDKVLGLGYN